MSFHFEASIKPIFENHVLELFWSRFTKKWLRSLNFGRNCPIFGTVLRYSRPKTYQKRKVVSDTFVIWNTLTKDFYWCNISLDRNQDRMTWFTSNFRRLSCHHCATSSDCVLPEIEPVLWPTFLITQWSLFPLFFCHCDHFESFQITHHHDYHDVLMASAPSLSWENLKFYYSHHHQQHHRQHHHHHHHHHHRHHHHHHRHHQPHHEDEFDLAVVIIRRLANWFIMTNRLLSWPTEYITTLTNIIHIKIRRQIQIQI